MMEYESPGNDLRPRSQIEDGNISKIFAFVLHQNIQHDEAAGKNFYHQTICSN